MLNNPHEHILNTNTENKASNCQSSMELLIELEHIILSLNEENFDLITQQIMKILNINFQYTFNVIISNLIFFIFPSKKNVYKYYLNFLEAIQSKEEEMKINHKIIEIFNKYVTINISQESYYLIEKMIEKNLLNESVIKNINSLYFSHRKATEKSKLIMYNGPFCTQNNTFIKNYDELSKNDWQLHMQLINEGVNPNEIAKIIRNDEIEKLQEISSQIKFDFNQTIEPSLYERCSFINQNNVTLIDYAAFFSAIKCFKYLLMNSANVYNTGKYAVAGGNLEIIYLCEQNQSSFDNAYETAIIFHRNDIFKYIYEKKSEKIQNLSTFGNSSLFNVKIDKKHINTIMEFETIDKLKYFCVISGNYELILYLEEEKKEINNFIINEAARIGNLFLVQHFLENNQIPNDILFKSLESENKELINYILELQEIDVNAKDVHL